MAPGSSCAVGLQLPGARSYWSDPPWTPPLRVEFLLLGVVVCTERRYLLGWR